MSAFVGFMTGFAKGAKERIEKEREDEEALISGRLKMAAANKIKREKETDAQKAMLTGRYEKVLPYAAGLSEQQKLALVSNDEIATQFYNRASKGETVDVDNLLKINEDKIPQNFTTVKSYIAQISDTPKITDPFAVSSLTEGKGFLNTRLATPARAQKIAQQYGGSVEELLAYENASAMAEMPQIATLNVDAIKKPKTLEERITEASTSAVDAYESGNMKAAKDAAARLSTLRELKKTLDPEQASWADTMGQLKMTMLNGTPEEQAKARKEYDRAMAIENRGKKDGESDKIPSASVLSGLFRNAGANAVAQKYGPSLKKDLVIETDNFGNSSFKYIGNDQKMLDQINETARQAQRKLAALYTMPDGTPMNRDVRAAMTVAGLVGEPITPEPLPPAAPPAPRPAGRGTTPAVAAPKTTTRAEVQAIATRRNVSYEDAARAAQAQGYTIID
jgi:hypothetical protein